MSARWTQCLLANQFQVAAGNHPDRLAVVDSRTHLTYAELVARVGRLAHTLGELGVSRGDRVAIWLPDRAEYYESYLGTAFAGAAHVPILARLTGEEAAYQVADSQASVIIVDTERALRLDAAGTAGLPARDRWLVLGPEAPKGTIAYDEALASAAPLLPEVDADENDLGWIRYTSGTTGRPKGSMNTFRGWWMLTQTMNGAWSIGSRDVFLASSPVSHTGGTMGVNHLVVGGTVVVPGDSRPETTVRSIVEHGVTNLFGVPTQYVMLLDWLAASAEKWDLSSLRVLTAAGAPMPGAVKAAISRMAPNARLYEFYSATEAPMMTMLAPDDAASGQETVGRPVGGSRLELRDVAGKPVRPGEVGRIWASNPMVHAGYWGGVGDKADDRGFVSVGDHGHLDPDGCLVLAGRESEMVISGGLNVYPKEVEQALGRHPAVRDAAMFGLPDPKWGELVAAVCVVDEACGLTPEQLREWARRHLSDYKIPRVLEFVPEIPRNEGKVRRGALPSLLTSRSAS